MPDETRTDATDALEQIRSADYADAVSADVLAAVYAIEHDNQFEDERGPTRASLRDLIAEAVTESS